MLEIFHETVSLVPDQVVMIAHEPVFAERVLHLEGDGEDRA